MILTLTLYLVGGIVISSLLFIPLRAIAFKIKLLDQPNSRKSHTRKIPLIGGVGIALTTLLLLVYAVFEGYSILELKPILLGSLILLIMGIVDDYIDLSAKLKLVIQLFTAHLLYFSGITLTSFHGLFGLYEIAPAGQYILTISIVTGVINAYNLIDGIDGLFAGFAIITIAVLSYLAFHFGKLNLLVLNFIIIGALIGFLKLNLKATEKIFMGDAGSLAIGFLLIGSGLLLLKGSPEVTPSSIEASIIFALLCLPVFDSLRVYYERTLKGRSPFKADKTHFHHFLLSIGLSHIKSSATMILILLTFIFLGITLSYIFNITTFTLYALFFYLLVLSVVKFFRKLTYWKHKIKRMESCM